MIRFSWDGIGWRWRLMLCDAMRCDAMAMDVTLIGRGGMDLGWIKWDVGLDLVIGRGRIGVEFGMKVFKYGWDEVGDSCSWITNIQRLLLMVRIALMWKKYIMDQMEHICSS